jgi:hypothetical protein
LRERATQKLADDSERLFELEEGGRAERPLAVGSASLVEVHARSVPCPRCNGVHDLLEHVALVKDGVRLREARLRCRQCGSMRSLFFRLLEARLN